jgi:hypothetical protein
MGVGMQTLLEPGIEDYVAVTAVETLCLTHVDMLLRAFVPAELFAKCPLVCTYIAEGFIPSGVLTQWCIASLLKKIAYHSRCLDTFSLFAYRFVGEMGVD